MKMKDVMNLFHISEGTIRYYEKMGVINPQRDENNYRVFDNESIIRLILSKKYTEFGFSYKESIDLINQKNFEEKTELLETQLSKIEDEINRLSVISDYCKEVIEDRERYKENEGMFNEETLLTSLYTDFGSADFEKNPSFFDNETIKYWFDLFAVSNFELWNDLNDDNWKWGYTINQDLYHRLGKEDCSFFDKFKDEKYLTTVTKMRYEDLKFLNDKVSEIKNYGKENGFILSGLIRVKAILFTSKCAYLKICAELKSA